MREDMPDKLTDHIVQAYNADIGRLDSLIGEMGGHCESQLAEAIQALQQRNSAQASEIAARDIVIDALEREIDALILRMLALRQPVAIDLRHTLAAMKIASALERVGDYAKNIAKRAGQLAELPPMPMTAGAVELGQRVQVLLHECLDAIANRDMVQAAEVWQKDQEIDMLHSGVLRDIIIGMAENPDRIEAGSHLQFIVKNLERIGDQATNMAEMVQFDVTGRRIEEERPKG
jgi:phosphate transport system protein